MAVLLSLKRFIRQPPQKVCCNFNNIEQIFPGAAALRARGAAPSMADLTAYPARVPAHSRKALNPRRTRVQLPPSLVRIEWKSIDSPIYEEATGYPVSGYLSKLHNILSARTQDTGSLTAWLETMNDSRKSIITCRLVRQSLSNGAS